MFIGFFLQTSNLLICIGFSYYFHQCKVNFLFCRVITFAQTMRIFFPIFWAVLRFFYMNCRKKFVLICFTEGWKKALSTLPLRILKFPSAFCRYECNSTFNLHFNHNKYFDPILEKPRQSISYRFNIRQPES